MIASFNGHVDIVKTLFEAKAQVNTQDKVHVCLVCMWTCEGVGTISESVDSLCRDGADRTRPFSKIEWLRTPKRGSYKPF